MTRLPFVLADRSRAVQFQMMAAGRNPSIECQFVLDEGIYWGYTSVDGHLFAVTSLGPNRFFDKFAREQGDVSIAAALRAAKVTGSRHRQKIQRNWKKIRLGGHTSRLCWAIHAAVLASKRSVVRIHDYDLRDAVWGVTSAYPRQWRQQLLHTLEGLTRLHLHKRHDGDIGFGASTAVLTHAADLRGVSDDECGDDCPGYGGAQHHHYLVNIGQGFLGALEQFGTDNGSGTREYRFPSAGGLRTVGEHLTTIYLPALLGEHDRCRILTSTEHRLLQTLVGEMTRDPRTSRTASNAAEVFNGPNISTTNGKGTIGCSLLAADEEYVGFNGNRIRKGLGYLLTSPGGWLSKAKFAIDDVQSFVATLQVLESRLGLIGVGIDRSSQHVFSSAEILTLARARSRQSQLNRIHLRVYCRPDFVERWNEVFGWSGNIPCAKIPGTSPGERFTERLHATGVSIREIARDVDADHSFLAKIL